MDSLESLMKKYPFRFEGPNIGDTAYWICVEGKNENASKILEVIIEQIQDAYDFAPRQDKFKEDWCIFYWINLYPNSAFTFGHDLFLTKEDAELYIKLNYE